MRILFFIFLTFCVSTQSFSNQFNAASDSEHSQPSENHEKSADSEVEDVDDFEKEILSTKLIQCNFFGLSFSSLEATSFYKSPYIERIIRPPRV